MKHRPYFHIRPLTANDVPWRIVHLCLSYGWPTGLKTAGGKHAIVSLGGGYYQSDIEQYFKYGNDHYPLPMPNLTDISVDPGAGNMPGSDADIENILDICASGTATSMATGQPANIGMFFANNDLGGIARAVAKASSLGYNTCSISWGSREGDWGHAAAFQMEQTALTAVTGGMIITAASGDWGSADLARITPPVNVDLPAACPHIIGCGGTNRPHSSSPSNPETAWNEGGGGFSVFFPRPAWQHLPKSLQVHPGRLVPDVSADSDPATGVHIVYQGQDLVVGGTSFSAPFWAGLINAIGAAGFITPVLWQNPSVFNDITIGSNGAWQAAPGPDPCTGMGTPQAAKIAALFGAK